MESFSGIAELVAILVARIERLERLVDKIYHRRDCDNEIAQIWNEHIAEQIYDSDKPLPERIRELTDRFIEEYNETKQT